MKSKRLPLAFWIFAGLVVGVVAGLALMNTSVAGMAGCLVAAWIFKRKGMWH